MLLLISDNVDICTLSKILAKHNVNAQVNGQTICIDGDISEKLLTELCQSTNVLSVQNFADIQNNIANKATVFSDNTSKETPQEPVLSPIIYNHVSRGQVYLCDLGECCTREQGGVRPVIVIQGNTFSKFYDTCVVIPLTSNIKKANSPGNFAFSFTEDILLECKNPLIFNTKTSVAILSQMKAIDNARLLKYLCTLTPDFMANLNNSISSFLSLEQTSNNVQTETIPTNTVINYEKPNEVQQEMLKLIPKNIAYSICSGNLSVSDKIDSLLELFGFDKKRRGVDLLTSAISHSLLLSSFNLEALSSHLAKSKTDIDSAEIQRLIIARVKERFNFKKSPTTDFIRLINNLILSKGESINE